MRRSLFLALLLAYFTNVCLGDVYLHNPRGSNNRLNERSAARTNGNRVFDSQNNARGGYNVGDRTAAAAGNNANNQYRMKYFQSGPYLTKPAPKGRSELVIEWTNQHGCGGNEDTDPRKQNCNLILQGLCQVDGDQAAPDDEISLRDGTQTTTQAYYKIASTSSKAQFEARKKADVVPIRAINEPWWWYDYCSRRKRNNGLFLATQQLAQDEAISTRQNPNAGRSGYECPEERDYYPYWHPTPFMDIAVLAQNETMCEYYKEHSFNRAPKSHCVEEFDAGAGGGVKHFSEHNNQADCETNGGTWTEFYSMLELAPLYTSQDECEQDHGDGMSYKWGKPFDIQKINKYEEITDVCFVQPPEVDCKAADWSRSNHLGNGREGVPLNYTWVIPYYPSGDTQRCIYRIRYNISTDDYDPYNTDSNFNGEEKSPVQQNPLVDVGANAQPLRLAINTAQTGRTFQDRSHVFTLEKRPDNFDSTARVLNMNVRGKRGNIVQTFPAVEYDFIPNRFRLNKNTDYLHIQWTGSNTHNNGAPGGDGQTGDAGEGTGGTDRHNMLQTIDANTNYPSPVESMTMWKDVEVVWSYNGDTNLTQSNIALILATAGYYECIEQNECMQSLERITQLNPQLNNAFASFEGVVLTFTKRDKYFFMCTRNNNFTNRSQKGHIIVE